MSPRTSGGRSASPAGMAFENRSPSAAACLREYAEQVLERPSSDTQRVRPWMLALGFPCLETVVERTSSTCTSRPDGPPAQLPHSEINPILRTQGTPQRPRTPKTIPAKWSSQTAPVTACDAEPETPKGNLDMHSHFLALLNRSEALHCSASRTAASARFLNLGLTVPNFAAARPVSARAPPAGLTCDLLSLSACQLLPSQDGSRERSRTRRWVAFA